MNLDLSIEGDWPAGTDWKALASRTSNAIGQVVPELTNPRLCASILFTGDDDIRALNRKWRDRDRPTNVLSFPMLAREKLIALPPEGPPELIGDVVLALETCIREAAEKSVPVEDHATHLIAHGLLHLAGYDHETGLEDAERMESLETKALAILGIEDPYGRLD